MKPYEEYEKTARDRRPFSNGTSWELFQFNVCLGAGDRSRECVNDDVDNGNGCPLILLSLDDKTPAEWGPAVRHCTEKTTAAEARRAERLAQADADRAAVEAAHYPMPLDFGEA